MRVESKVKGGLPLLSTLNPQPSTPEVAYGYNAVNCVKDCFVLGGGRLVESDSKAPAFFLEETMKICWKGILSWKSFLSSCFLFICLCLVCGYTYGLGQKEKKLSKGEVNEIIRQELEAKREEVTVWKMKWSREYESRKGLEMQIAQIRAAVAKAARL